MTRRLSDERGFALVPALMVMLCFLLIGVAVLDTVDVQQRESRRERERDSTFQLAEGVLNAQIYRLGQAWPGQAPNAFPLKCDGTVANDKCPTSAILQGAFNTADYGGWGNVEWTTYVRDNSVPTPNFYSDELLTDGTKSYDENGDQQIWVRAQAQLKSPNTTTEPAHTRTLVALVKAEMLPSLFVPNKTLVAGWFKTTNQGNKNIINNGPTGEVVVRGCDDASEEPEPITEPEAGCAEYRDNVGQIDPERIVSQSNYPDGIDHDVGLEALRATAASQGNYYATCPASLQGDQPGEVVFIENANGCPKYNGNVVYNTAAKPGSVVIGRGGPLELNGGATFYGLIYHANLDNSSATLIDLSGNTRVYGGVVIDGNGGALVGSSGGNNPKNGNLHHNPNAGGSLEVFGTAGIVQNSFREINATVRD